MFNRRDFIKTAVLAANVGMVCPLKIFAARDRKTTGYFGVHPFIENHPEAVFIMFTDVDVKTNAKANKFEGERFAREVLVPMDESGIPTSRLIPIKPNITGGGGNTYDTMGIITDPHFVEGVIEGMKQLGISKKQFFLREVNCINWEKHMYYPIAKRTGADLHNMNGRVRGIDNERLSEWSRNNAEIDDEELQWVDVPNGVVYRKIPYLWPINAPDTFLLNIAKFKAHSMGLTLCCKNFQGAVANGYQHFCQKMGSILTMPPEHRNPNVEKDFQAYMKRHVGTLPRWDRPIKDEGDASATWVDRYDTVCQELWTHRTLDSLSVTKFGLHVVEGIYGRDGNFSPGPNPEGNDNNPRGKAWDYMTNILIFGMDPFKVDIVGKWLGGHEPGNFGFFHIAMERGMLNGLNPMNIPVYRWHNSEAVRTPLTHFTRTPLKSYYLQKENEPFWHLVDEPFDYNAIYEDKPAVPSKPGAQVLVQTARTAFYPMLSIEYRVPKNGNVMLEIIDDKGETVVVLVNAIRYSGSHMASWNTETYNSGKYTCRYRFNDYSETQDILLMRG
ncbi:MAG: DUF362 domain-containing protein [Candidatus Latescibacteria bacterium]|nr:DUF362 domain-containing protein [Candidatus Latescibacterota bacterium]